MIILLWVLNFGISALNAFGCGNTWDSSKARGGLAHFMNWMGAIMSASGFTWCYLVVLGLLGAITPLSLFADADDGPLPTGMLLDEASLKAFFDLGYMVIILPILGSGLAITVNTWREFARARQRGVGDYAIVGWNTFAQIHNTVSAAQAIPGVLSSLGDFFFGGKDNKGKGSLIVVVLVIAAALGGVLTTTAIIQARRRAVRLNDYNHSEMAA